jgi:hypothetical protein
MKIRIMMFTLFLYCSISCSSNKNILFIESPDKSSTITVITESDVRYIIDGKHRKVPSSNYVKLDISKVSPIGDQIGICWGIEGYKWRLVNDQSILINNKLDSALYDFKEKLERTEIGAPSFKEYLHERCVRVSVRENRVDPENGAKLIYN